MGAASSSLDTNSPSPPAKALHVLRVAPDSPADYVIEPFFDFVVGIDNGNLSSNIDAATLGKLVEQHEGKELPLVIWSAKYRQFRVVPVTPSRSWTKDAPSLLGLSMRLCTPEYALENVWHILEVLENSPAESAGLVPYGDWIIGWSGGALSGENAFYELVEAHIDKPLRATVYSYDFDTIREVVLVPNRKWGGEGLLGCGVGYGLLHRIPPQPVNSEAMDTILKQNIPYDEQDPFDEKRPHANESTTLFIPADDDNFEFGGVSGQPKGFDEDTHPSASSENFDETPVAHWHAVNDPPKRSDETHRGHTGGSHSYGDHHGHSHDHGQHSHSHDHSHSHSPSPQPPTKAKPRAPMDRRSDSISSLKSESTSATTPPPRASTPTQSGIPLSHSLRNSLNGSFNGIAKPEPLRKLGSPPASATSPRARMRGGIVHSPANSGRGTPTRVKSPEASAPPGIHTGTRHDDDDEGSDSTSRVPGSPGGSITSVD